MPPLTKALPLVLLGIVGITGVMAGCGVPPELQPPPGAQVPAPSGQPPTSGPYPPGFTPRATGTPTPLPTVSPFPEVSSVACAGRPTDAQVIALVKKETPIQPTKAVTAPVCAGTWQYTVLEVPGREPLQVLSKGDPAALTLVAIGTDVCTVDVRRQAPTGILLAASC